MPKGTTVDSAANRETLEKPIKAIEDRRPGKLSKGIALLQDNAIQHSANVTNVMKLLQTRSEIQKMIIVWVIMLKNSSKRVLFKKKFFSN